LRDFRGESAGGDRDLPAGEAKTEIGGENPDRLYGVLIVRQRLPHAHQNDVLDCRPFRRVAAEHGDLTGDLRGSEVSLQPLSPGHAEPAAHRTAGLGGDAGGPVVPARNENAFDEKTVFEAEQQFSGSVL